jgi:uncharacterized cupredoxin-like copper-binding protein
MLLGLPGAQAADTWPVGMNWDTENVSIRLATGRGNLVIQPGEVNLKAGELYGEVNLEAGELYRLVIVNDSGVTHSISAPEFAGTVLTSHPATMSIVSGTVMRPGEKMEWYLMPVTEGTYKFGCSTAVHAAAGMEATIHVL